MTNTFTQEHRKISDRLTLDEATRTAFASGPLAEIDLEKYVVFLSREELKRGPVSSMVPFDVSLHSQAKSAVALSMTARLQNDMKIYADQQNNGKTPKCLHLLDEDITEYVIKEAPDAQERIEKVCPWLALLNVLTRKHIGDTTHADPYRHSSRDKGSRRPVRQRRYSIHQVSGQFRATSTAVRAEPGQRGQGKGQGNRRCGFRRHPGEVQIRPEEILWPGIRSLYATSSVSSHLR